MRDYSINSVGDADLNTFQMLMSQWGVKPHHQQRAYGSPVNHSHIMAMVVITHTQLVYIYIYNDHNINIIYNAYSVLSGHF